MTEKLSMLNEKNIIQMVTTANAYKPGQNESAHLKDEQKNIL